MRKYYRQDFAARIAGLFAPAQNARGNFQQRGNRQEAWRDRPKGEWRGRGGPQRPEPGSRNTPYVVVSQQMATSPLHRGRTTVPRREALILQAALNHPWLLHDHLEELSHLEFRNADAEKLKGALIDIAAHAATLDPEALQAELAARNLSEPMARIAAAITTSAVWGAAIEAAPDDVLVTWQQLVALQRKRNSLVREVMEAEQAFNQDYTDRNYLRLKDANERLSSLDGTEAMIEGFGASSGRGVRSL